MDKKVTESVSIVIYDNEHKNVLATRRPLDDKDHPGMWGFPAVSRRNPRETWEDLAKKTAITKLGVEVEVLRLIGEDSVERKDYILTLRDYECRITRGQPTVPQPNDGHTQYMEMKYTDDFKPFIETARSGSLCTKIFLEEKGILIN